MPDDQPTYGLMAEFDSHTELLRAAEAVRDRGYRRFDTFTPYPIEGMMEAMGKSDHRLSYIVLFGGIVGALSGFFMEWFASVRSYPLNVGGRPWNSWPSFIPITFEMGVLFASFAALFGFMALSHLPKPYHPVFNVPRFSQATRDRFFLCIEAVDPRFDEPATRRLLEDLHPLGVYDVAA